MKVAYFGCPHVGGTFEVYRHLAEGLGPWGIEVQWVGVGPKAHEALSDPRWAAELARGLVVGQPDDGGGKLAGELTHAIANGGFKAVFVNVLADAVQTNVARFLPASVIRILIVHNITPATYDAAYAVRDHVHATVAISPRIRHDLLRRYRFAADRVELIPHAANVSDRPMRDRPARGPLRALFLGRIEDASKGVLALPDIMERLPSDLTLTVAGEGPDSAELKRRCSHLDGRVRFLGAVERSEATSLLEEHDVMIMPSRFEGFGLTLIEAMAAGCVPVVTRIHGVTDWLVEHRRNGMLFSMEDWAEAAAMIRHLDQDRMSLHAMALAGGEMARRDFDRATMASRYAALLQRVTSHPSPIAAPLDLERWEMPSGLRTRLRTHLPAPLKNLLRRVYENGMARHVRPLAGIRPQGRF